MGLDRANPMAAFLRGVMMLDYLADKLDLPAYGDASRLLDHATTAAFENNDVRPMEFGGDMGTRAVKICPRAYNSRRYPLSVVITIGVFVSRPIFCRNR